MMLVKNNIVSLFLRLTSVSIFVSIVTLVANFVVTKFADKEFFADFTVYQSYYFILSNFLPLGITSAVVFFNDQCDDSLLFSILKRYILYIIPALSVVIYSTIIGFAYFSGDGDGVNAEITIFITIAAYSQSSINILISFYQVTNQYRYFVRIAFINVAMLVIAYVAGVFIFKEVVYLFLIYGVLTLALLIFFLRDTSSKYNKKYIESSLNRSILVYSLPTAINSSVISFLVTGDKVLIGGLTNDSSVIADYGYASFIASLFLFIVNNVATTIGVFMSQLKRDSVSDSHFCDSVKKGQNKNIIFIMLGLLFYPVTYISQFLLDLTDVDLYLIISGIILCSYCIHGVSKLYLGFLNTYKYSVFILGSGAASCIVVMLLYTSFFNWFGVAGVSISFFIGTLVYFTLLLLGSRWVMQKYAQC